MTGSSFAYRLYSVLYCVALIAHASRPAEAADSVPALRVALVEASQVTPQRLRDLSSQNFNSVAIAIDHKAPFQPRLATIIRDAGLGVSVWIEVARSPRMADQHPDWMASLQTHEEWRRFYPETRVPEQHEVVKSYPWVPITSREPFVGQLARIRSLLTPCSTVDIDHVFLNDLQGAPSACGCGNPLCRWTSDYGPRRTTTPLSDDAAALFVTAVAKFVPRSEVVPVWTTECEAADAARDGMCAGVGCFDGICWKAYTRQLAPLAATCRRLGVLTPYRLFERDTDHYGRPAGWIAHAVDSFVTMPRKHGQEGVSPDRLITILQGWDVDQTALQEQIDVAVDTGVAGYVVAFTPIEQSWQPKIVSWH